MSNKIYSKTGNDIKHENMCQGQVKHSTNNAGCIIIDPHVALFWVESWQFNNNIKLNSIVWLGYHNKELIIIGSLLCFLEQ